VTLDCVHGHTVDVDLFTKGGWVLDAGCRDFHFTKYATRRGCNVVALDADPTVADPHIEDVHFYNSAIAAYDGVYGFSMHENPEARGLSMDAGSAPSIVQVPVGTLAHWTTKHKVGVWDCVKLDVEGAEYGILTGFPGPVAKQVSIEFHDHQWKRPVELYEQIYEHLSQWYVPLKWYAGDTLFALKSLAKNAETQGHPWWRS